MRVSTPADPVPTPQGFVRLTASVPLRSGEERIAQLLDRGEPWTDDLVERPEVGGLRRYAVDLRLRIGESPHGLTTFRKAAYVDLGHPRLAAEGWEAEIGWRSSTAAPLFPVFAGWLFLRKGELRIDGLYAPPGGVLGRAADRVLLHLAANATARWVLGEIDRAALGGVA